MMKYLIIALIFGIAIGFLITEAFGQTYNILNNVTPRNATFGASSTGGIIGNTTRNYTFTGNFIGTLIGVNLTNSTDTLDGFDSAFFNPLNSTYYGNYINLTGNLTSNRILIDNNEALRWRDSSNIARLVLNFDNNNNVILSNSQGIIFTDPAGGNTSFITSGNLNVRGAWANVTNLNVSSGLIVTSAGRVGIGTTAPDAALEINHATGDNLRLTYNDADGSAAYYTDFSTTSDGGLVINSSSTILMGFVYDSAFRVRPTVNTTTVLFDVQASDASSRFAVRTPTSVSGGVNFIQQGWDVITLTGANPTTYASMTTMLLQSLSYTARNAGQTITNAYTIWVDQPLKDGGSGNTPTITSNYGIVVADVTSGTNDYGIAIEGADTAALWLSSAADNTDAANGISFGSSKDTNLYRSAANVLRTDDSFVAGGTWLNGTQLNVSSTAYIQGSVGIGTTSPLDRLDVSGGNITLSTQGALLNMTVNTTAINCVATMEGSIGFLNIGGVKRHYGCDGTNFNAFY